MVSFFVVKKRKRGTSTCSSSYLVTQYNFFFDFIDYFIGRIKSRSKGDGFKGNLLKRKLREEVTKFNENRGN